MTSLSLKNICSILEHNVDNELLLKYIPSINAPIVSNQSEFQSMLINMLDSYRPILSHRRIEILLIHVFDNLNELLNNAEAERIIHFLKLCSLLYCDSAIPLDLKLLIVRRIIPKFPQCTVNVYFTFLKEMWLFCIRLSRSDSKQEQATAYFLFEQMVHLYAPPEDSSGSNIGGLGSFEIRMESKLERFLIHGLTFPLNRDGFGFNAIQAAALNITKQVISFKQPSSSSITNNFLWNESDEVDWGKVWKSYIELYELMGVAEGLSEDQVCNIRAYMLPIDKGPYLGIRWTICFIQRGLGNIYPNVRKSVLHAILASTHQNTDFDSFVLFELPWLLDYNHLYSVNEEDPLQCSFGVEVSQLYYSFLQQGNSRKQRDNIRTILKLLANFDNARAILFFAHALYRLPRFPLMDAETHENIIKITRNKEFSRGGVAENLKTHRDALLLKVVLNFIGNDPLIDAGPTFMAITETMDHSFRAWLLNILVQEKHKFIL